MDGQNEYLALTGAIAVKSCTAIISHADEAEDISQRLRLIALGNNHFHRFATISDYLEDHVDIESIISNYLVPIDSLYQRLAPQGLAQALLTVRAGLLLSDKLSQVVGNRLEKKAQDALGNGQLISRTQLFISELLREQLSSDPLLVDSLRLLSRRLIGEIVALVQRISAEQPELVAFVTNKSVGVESLSAIGELISKLTQALTDDATACLSPKVAAAS